MEDSLQQTQQQNEELVLTPRDVLFECPQCGKGMVIDEEAVGHIVDCPGCHITVIVPERSHARIDPSSEQESAPSTEDLLLQASKEGDAALVRELLAKAADVHARNRDGWTALMLAAHCGEGEIVETLLENGADVHAEDLEGNTALKLAEKAGDVQVIRLLWKFGAKN